MRAICLIFGYLNQKNPDKIIDVSKIKASDIKKVINEIVRLPTKNVISVIDKMHMIQDITSRYKNLGSQLLKITQLYANDWEDIPKREMNIDKNVFVKWNKTLTDFGYDGISDKKGFGDIHINEPMQAVFFSLNTIDIIKEIDNKTSKIKNIDFNKNYITISTVDDFDKVKLSTLLQIPALWRKDMQYSINRPMFYNDNNRVIFTDSPFKLLRQYLIKYFNSTEIKNCLKNSNATTALIVALIGLVDLSKYPNMLEFILQCRVKRQDVEEVLSYLEAFKDFETISDIRLRDFSIAEKNIKFIKQQLD